MSLRFLQQIENVTQLTLNVDQHRFLRNSSVFLILDRSCYRNLVTALKVQKLFKVWHNGYKMKNKRKYEN